MLVGESPSDYDKADKLLDSILFAFDLSRENLSIAYAVPHKLPDNRRPKSSEITAHRSNLFKQIKEAKPKLIIAMGAIALEALTKEKLPVTASRKKLFRIGKKERPMVVTFHPAAAVRNDYLTEKIVEDFEYGFKLLRSGFDIKEDITSYRRIDSLSEDPATLNASVVSLDLETDGLDPYLPGRQILSVQVSSNPGTGCFLRWTSRVKEEIKTLVSSKVRTIVNHNIKFDMKWLREEGIHIHGPVRDTMLEAHLLDENNRDKSLGSLANTYTSLKDHKEGLETYRKQNKCAHKDVPEEIMIPYGCADVDAALRLDQVFMPKLLKQGLGPLMDLEGEAIKLFVEIESNGCKIDMSIIDGIANHYEKQIRRAEKVILEVAGSDFNDRSPVQIKKIIYDKWDLPPMGLVKPWEKKDGYDTTEYTLDRLVHSRHVDATQKSFLEAILRLRENRKMLSTYVLGLSDHIRPGSYIHSWFRLDGTVTGRLSSRDINLQNIPREGPIKSLFVSRYGADGVVLQCDLSQAELRFAAHVSGEPTLTRLFNRGSSDIHRETAAQVLGKRTVEVTDKERKKAKIVNFGILYGASKYKMAEQMGTSVEIAAQFIERWKARFYGWAPYERNIRKLVIERGYVTSPFGRRRRLPIMDPGSKQGKEALRQAINSPIQGGVCDYTLYCGVRANRARKKQGLRRCHFIAQVHDAWILDCHKSEVADMARIMTEHHQIRELPEFGIKLAVPMVIECQVGPNWKEVKEYA
jgi:DNA polymerase-1